MIQPQTEENDYALVRGTVYRLLSQCFFQPTEELVSSLLNGPLVQTFKMTVGMLGDEKADQAIASIEEYREKCQGLSIPDIGRELKVEFNRLFVGPGHLPTPPYESVYHTKNEENKDGLVMGDETLDAKRQYLSAGIALPEEFTDLPDHIGVELDFVSCLCFEEAEMLHKGNEEETTELMNKQYEFLTSHLDRWITPFSEAICVSSHSEFYRGIAQISASWVHYDKEEFDLLGIT